MCFKVQRYLQKLFNINFYLKEYYLKLLLNENLCLLINLVLKTLVVHKLLHSKFTKYDVNLKITIYYYILTFYRNFI